MIVIRRAKFSDIASISALGRNTKELAVSDKTRFYTEIELKQWIRNPKDNLLFVALDNKTAVGFIFAKLIASDWCVIDNAAVDKKYRRTGIGSMLVLEIMSQLRKRKVGYVQLIAGLAHKDSIAYWKKQGFKPCKKFVWMEKFI